MNNLDTDATVERLQTMARDLEEQMISRHDQLIRDMTDYVINTYFSETPFTEEEKQAVAKRIAKSFDHMVAKWYVTETYEDFSY